MQFLAPTFHLSLVWSLMAKMDSTQQTMQLIQICQQKIEDFVLIIIKFRVNKFVVVVKTIGIIFLRV